MEHRYVILPSNSSMTVHPDNTLANFKVQLARPLQFLTPFEVAITEIIYPHVHLIVKTNEAFAEIHREPYENIEHLPDADEYTTYLGSATLTAGSYKKASDIVSSLIKGFKDFNIHIRYSEAKNRFGIAGLNKLHLQMSSLLARMLGFGDGLKEIIKIDKDGDALFPPDLTGGLHSMFVYTNVVESQFIGDKFAPLLRVICPDNKNTENALVSEKYIKPYYLKTSKNYIDAIDISIQTETGQPYPFPSGSALIIKLHFRPLA